MSQTTLSIIILLVLVMVGIIYHEYGHMKVAKKHNITVKTFCIGFGKPIIKRTGKDGTVYGIAPFPFGGYCSIDDEALDETPFKVYASVLLAGVIRNVILGTVLMVIGQLILFGGFYNPIVLLQNAFEMFVGLVKTFGDALLGMFDIKAMATVGGFAGQMSATGETIVGMSQTTNQVVGFSVMMAGYMNYVLAMCNILPIPGVDGGQVVTKLVCIFSEKAFKKKISKVAIGAVNLTMLVLIVGYQVLLLTLDIPFVQSFILNM